MVLVMENSNIGPIITNIHITNDITNKTQNFQNRPGKEKTEMSQHTDADQEGMTFC